MKNTAILGGSFNPPTLAHIQIAKEVDVQTDITHFILSPSGDRADKKQTTSIQDRHKMMEIFSQILQDMGLNIELDTHFLEGKNGGHTTTAQEEEYFRKKNGTSPHFIYGSDIAPAMPTWSGNKNKFIEEKLKKIFLPRPGYQFEPEKHGLKNFTLLDIPHMLDISSSMAREMILNKQDVSEILEPKLIEHIEENKLYR